MSTVTLPPARQATAYIPQPVADDSVAEEVGVGEEPRHLTVAVEERVDPRQPVVRRGECDERAHAVLFCGVVEEGEALVELGEHLGFGRDVPAHLEVSFAKRTAKSPADKRACRTPRYLFKLKFRTAKCVRIGCSCGNGVNNSC